MSTGDTVAKNISNNYGGDMLKYLLDSIKAGTSGTEIGEAFGVTRQRVNQWKAALVVKKVKPKYKFVSMRGLGTRQ